MDIFGKNPRDYQFMQGLEKSGKVALRDSYLKKRATDFSAKTLPHNFNALGAGVKSLPATLQDADNVAQAVQYATNNQQAVMSQVEEILYVDFRVPEMMPVVSNIPEGAASYSYRVTDKVGRGKFIDVKGSNAPSAGASMRNVAYELHYGGIIPSWTFEDLRKAMFGGMPLDTYTVDAGTQGALDHIESVALVGDSDRGLTGLINNSDIPVTNTLTKTIAASTPDEKVQILQNAITALVVQTEEVVGRVIKSELCVWLPISQFANVSQTRLPDTGMNVWNYVKENNTWKDYTSKEVRLKALKELKGASAAGNTDRMIVGVKDAKVMEFPIAISPRVLHTVYGDYEVRMPMEYKIGGLNTKIPMALSYTDNV